MAATNETWLCRLDMSRRISSIILEHTRQTTMHAARRSRLSVAPHQAIPTHVFSRPRALPVRCHHQSRTTIQSTTSKAAWPHQLIFKDSRLLRFSTSGRVCRSLTALQTLDPPSMEFRPPASEIYPRSRTRTPTSLLLPSSPIE